MKQNYLIIFAIAIIVATNSCGNADSDSGKTPIARVYDNYLYYEDLGDAIPKGCSEIDSILVVKQLIKAWTTQQLMIKVAEINLTPEQMDVKRQIDEYRNNLLIYKYKDLYISKNLDTVVSDADRAEYYLNHPADFLLNNLAIKAIFVKVPIVSDDLWQIRRLLDFRSEKDSVALLELCKQEASKFVTFDNHWVTLQTVNKYMNDVISEKNDALKTHGTIVQNDGEYSYMLKIRDYIPVGDVMPLEMAEQSISRILINKRKIKLVSILEQNIYDDAEARKNLEFFHYDRQESDDETK